MNLLYRELDWELSPQSRSQGKTEKERTDKTLPSEKELGKRLKDLNKNIYYTKIGEQGDNIRIFFCSDKLTGSNINARANTLNQPKLLKNLRTYFSTKFNVMTESQKAKYYTRYKSQQGAFFLHVIIPTKEMELGRALNKMGVPSDDEYRTRRVTVKIPKRKK